MTTAAGENTDYDFQAHESKWADRWIAEPPARFDVETADPARKFYNLVEFPYPSAEGLHVGHVYTYCGADAYGRYMTMNGRQVLQPMGFDSFGIHTENFALKINEQPQSVTDRATANYRRQLERVGANWSWDLVLRTDDPDYYRWTQWIFLQLFKAGLAERKESGVIWCSSCLTVLAFEQVDGNRCERCGTEVETKVMRQWFLKITAYADELIDALDDLDWPDLSKRLQKEWIGRSTGADVDFALTQDPTQTLTAFTTRPDTLYGVSFVALAPEHPFVATLIEQATNGAELSSYVASVLARVGTARYTKIADSGPPGVVTDVTVQHPITGAEVPLVVADYVLADYGTGVVMGVPAHDDRDHAFATTLDLPIVTVVQADGTLTGSAEFDGLRVPEAQVAIAARLAEQGRGGPITRYRLQDWLVSRQRYWGSPIPIIYCDTCGMVPVPETDLPVTLPEIEDFRPTGSELSPLAVVDSFVNVACPTCGGPAKRETDVFDTFVESSWYFLRYPSVGHDEAGWDPELTKRLLPVDLYAGGREHSTRHHLYARFVTRALHDLGHVPFAEPFTKLRLHGLLIKDGAKMSKSRGNVVNPDEYIDRVGADNLRSYLLFCGPWEEGGDFTDRGLQGVVRFNVRLFNLIATAAEPSGPGADLRQLHRSIAKVGKDIERLKFNTAIAEVMTLTNWMRDTRESMTAEQWAQVRRTVILLLAPLEPFMAEELWSQLGGGYSVHQQEWPAYDPAALVSEEVTIAVQVNGKLRGTVVVPAGAESAEIEQAARGLSQVSAALGDRELKRVIYVPGRTMNLVG
ncbi:MAG TPA: leucine--tRNA ligase [Propionibacteriaceae bacterium]